MPAALRDVKQQENLGGGWHMVHVIPEAKWPQKLFFYWKGETTPRYTFTRASLTRHWLEQGKPRGRFSAMSKTKVADWVRPKRPPVADLK